jgi:hypothetical protein
MGTRRRWDGGMSPALRRPRVTWTQAGTLTISQGGGRDAGSEAIPTHARIRRTPRVELMVYIVAKVG